MQFDLSIPPITTWAMDSSAVFCKVAEQYGEFSNLNRHYPYSDSGVQWLGTEAQYQAMRFPHLPDHQEKIRAAQSLMASKHVAYEQIENTRPDWDEVKIHAMAYVLTQKLRSEDFSRKLEAIGTLPIVELSMRDDFWGAKPRGLKLVGRNVLGRLLKQLQAGARMNVLPAHTTFPPGLRGQQNGFDRSQCSMRF